MNKPSPTPIQAAIRRKYAGFIPGNSEKNPILESIVALGVGTTAIARCIGVKPPSVSGALAQRDRLSLDRTEQVLRLLDETLEETAIAIRQFENHEGDAYIALLDEFLIKTHRLWESEQQSAEMFVSLVMRVKDEMKRVFDNVVANYELYANAPFIREDASLEAYSSASNL